MKRKGFLGLLVLTLYFPLLRAQVIDTICVFQNPSHLAVPFTPGSSYQWTVNGGQIISVPADSNDILVQWNAQAGVHQVSVVETNAHGCEGDPVDSYIYLVNPGLSKIQGPAEVCKGTEVTLYADGGTQFLWSDGSRSAEVTFVAEKDTSLYLVNENGPCTNDTAYHHVNVVDPPEAHINNLPDSVLIGSSMRVTYTGSTASWKDWYVNNVYFTSGEYMNYTFDEVGEYLLTVVAGSGGCTDTTDALLKVYKQFAVHIPNAFTPNGDGANDRFYFDGVGMASYTATIWDRWGEMLYEWDMNSEGWDGTYKGWPVKQDVYIYHITVFDRYGKPHKFSGDVKVIR